MKLIVNATCITTGKMTGIERFTLRLCQELCFVGEQVEIFTADKLPGISSLHSSKLYKVFNGICGRYEFIIRALLDQTYFRYIIAKKKPDVVFFPIQDGMIFPAAKQIVTVHDLHYLHFDVSIPECGQEISFFRKKIFQTKIPHILQKSVAVVAVSESTKKELVDSFNVDPHKVHVIYNGYDESRFHVLGVTSHVLEKYNLVESKYFLFVGSILRHKNLLRLLYAFSQIGRDTILVISGVTKDADYFQEIIKTTSDLGIQNEVVFLEYVNDQDLPYLYSSALAFILPSLHEGFGVPIIEAMACGAPVITSNISAMPEVAGDAAILIDPYSIESIASAMREIMDNPEQAQTLRTAGLARARMFNWSFSAQKLYDLCKEVSCS